MEEACQQKALGWKPGVERSDQDDQTPCKAPYLKASAGASNHDSDTLLRTTAFDTVQLITLRQSSALWIVHIQQASHIVCDTHAAAAERQDKWLAQMLLDHDAYQREGPSPEEAAVLLPLQERCAGW